MAEDPSSVGALRRLHPSLRWTLFETSTRWLFAYGSRLLQRPEVFAQSTREQRCAAPDLLVMGVSGFGYGPVGAYVVSGRRPRGLPQGRALGDRVIRVEGDSLRVGPYPQDGNEESITLPSPGPVVRVSLAFVAFDPEAPDDGGWILVTVAPQPEATKPSDEGAPIDCEW